MDTVLTHNPHHEEIRCFLFTGLVLANGRLGEDSGIGEFTFASHQGQSVVDFFLFNPDDRQFINNFVILPFEEYSDHAALNIKLQTKTTVKEKACHEQFNAEIRLCWDNAKREAFRSDIANTFESINDLTAHLDRTADSTEINIIVNNFVNELYQKALPHFGKPVNVNRNTKCCHKIEINGLIMIVKKQVKILNQPETHTIGIKH